VVAIKGLGLKARQQSERLGVSLKPTDSLSCSVEGVLTVVTKRRMPQVVAQTGNLNKVGVGPECHSELASDLPHLEAVRQSRPREVLFASHNDLGLPSQATQT
jgi:hypothetical protein